MTTLKDLLSQQDDLPAMDVEPIRKVLDDDMPAIDESQLGRMRLHQALAKRYGQGYKSAPGVQEALDHYDKEVKFLNLYKKTVAARHGVKYGR